MRAHSLVGKLLFLLLLSGVTACSAPVFPADNRAPDQTARLETDRIVMSDGYSLPLTRWSGDDDGAPRAVVLALHGFNDYRAAFRQLAEGLANHRIRTYAYDQRGFGETEGRGEWHGSDRLANDALNVLTLLKQRYPDTPVYLLGKSMGGAVAITAMTRNTTPEIAGTILVSPAVWARSTMPWYQRWALAVAVRVAPSRTVSPRGLDIQPSDNIEMLRAWSQDPLVLKETRIDAVYGLGNLMDQALAAVPGFNSHALILYGENDEVIPPRPTCRMLETLPGQPPGDWHFVLYPEGYHMLTRDLQMERVHTDIAAWINEDTIPSGLEKDRTAAMETLCE